MKYNIEDVFDFEGSKELFEKHQFDYAVCTSLDFDFNTDKGTFEIAWDQLSFDDVIMRNCNGKDCKKQESEYIGKYKACYNSVSLRNVLDAEGIKY